MQRQFLIILLSLLALTGLDTLPVQAAAPVIAAENGEKTANDTLSEKIYLPPVTVEADKDRFTPGKIARTATGKWMEFNTGSVLEALKYFPDVRIAEYGTGGSLKTVNIDGFNGSRVAVNFEGLPMNSQQNGTVDFSYIPLNAVNEIGVKYGGNAPEGGSSAMGGVVNLSLFPAEITNQARLRLSYGSFDNKSVAFTGKWAKSAENGFIFSVSGSSGKDDYPYREFSDEKKVYNGDYTRQDFTLGWRLNIDRIHEIRLFGFYTGGESGIPSASRYNTARQKNADQYYGIKYRYRFKRLGELAFTGGYIRQNLGYDNPAFAVKDDYLNQAYYAAAKFHIRGLNRLRLGLNYRLNTLASTQIDEKREADINFSLIGQHTFIWGIYSLVLNAGGNLFYSDYDGRTHPDYRAGIKLIGEKYDLYLSLHSGFRKPTFNDRYWPGSGNPDLKTESSRHFTAGIKIPFRSWLEISFDYTRYIAEDLIRWVQGSANLWRPENMDRVDGNIINFRVSGEFSTLAYVGGITRQRVDKGGGQLRLTPEFTGNFHVFYRPFSSLTFFAGSLFESKKYLSDGVENYFLPEYGILNAGVSVTFSSLRVSLKINNLTDEQYYIQPDFPMKGRNYSFMFEYGIGE